MKCRLVALLAALATGTGHAQTFSDPTIYLGGSLALLTGSGYTSPLLGVQAGVGLAPNLELRGTFETVVSGSNVAAELLYRVPLAEVSSLYLGAGPEVLFSPALQPTLEPTQTTPLGDPNFVLHGTLGLEVRVGRLGFFGEVQPIVTPAYFHVDYGKLRTGVNVYF